MAQQLKLEVGKKYLTRDGRVAEVNAIADDGHYYPASGEVDGDGRRWRSDGQWLDGRKEDLDLVSEYVETPKLKIEPGKKYLTRDGRVARVLRITDDWSYYPVLGEVDSNPSRWRSDGRWVGDEEEYLDLVSEYVETPAAPVTYRYFRFPERPGDSLHDVLVWRNASGSTFADAIYLHRSYDTWEATTVTLDDNLSDPDMIECDENGVPLSPPPAPEPRIPEGFIEVSRTYPSFTPEARATVLIRVSDIVLVQANTDGCIVKTASFPQGYPITESYTTVLEKINAALP